MMLLIQIILKIFFIEILLFFNSGYSSYSFFTIFLKISLGLQAVQKLMFWSTEVKRIAIFSSFEIFSGIFLGIWLLISNILFVCSFDMFITSVDFGINSRNVFGQYLQVGHIHWYWIFKFSSVNPSKWFQRSSSLLASISSNDILTYFFFTAQTFDEI